MCGSAGSRTLQPIVARRRGCTQAVLRITKPGRNVDIPPTPVNGSGSRDSGGIHVTVSEENVRIAHEVELVSRHCGSVAPQNGLLDHGVGVAFKLQAAPGRLGKVAGDRAALDARLETGLGFVQNASTATRTPITVNGAVLQVNPRAAVDPAAARIRRIPRECRPADSEQFRGLACHPATGQLGRVAVHPAAVDRGDGRSGDVHAPAQPAGRVAAHHAVGQCDRGRIHTQCPPVAVGVVCDHAAVLNERLDPSTIDGTAPPGEGRSRRVSPRDRDPPNPGCLVLARVEEQPSSLTLAVDDAVLGIPGERSDNQVLAAEVQIPVAGTGEGPIFQLDDEAGGNRIDGGLNRRVVAGPVGANNHVPVAGDDPSDEPFPGWLGGPGQAVERVPGVHDPPAAPVHVEHPKAVGLLPAVAHDGVRFEDVHHRAMYVDLGLDDLEPFFFRTVRV